MHSSWPWETRSQIQCRSRHIWQWPLCDIVHTLNSSPTPRESRCSPIAISAMFLLLGFDPKPPRSPFVAPYHSEQEMLDSERIDKLLEITLTPEVATTLLAECTIIWYAWCILLHFSTWASYTWIWYASSWIFSWYGFVSGMHSRLMLAHVTNGHVPVENFIIRSWLKNWKQLKNAWSL